MIMINQIYLSRCFKHITNLSKTRIYGDSTPRKRFIPIKFAIIPITAKLNAYKMCGLHRLIVFVIALLVITFIIVSIFSVSGHFHFIRLAATEDPEQGHLIVIECLAMGLILLACLCIYCCRIYCQRAIDPNEGEEREEVEMEPMDVRMPRR